MTITATVMPEADKLREQNAQLRTQVYELGGEIAALRDVNVSPSWMQAKVARQAKYLRNLNRRVRVQRLILRELNTNHPEIAESLFHMVSDKYATELDDEITLIW